MTCVFRSKVVLQSGKSFQELCQLPEGDLKVLFVEPNGPAPASADARRADFLEWVAYFKAELKRIGVIRKLLWQEYTRSCPRACKEKNIFGTRNVTCYICRMIESIQHKGLKRFYEKGDSSKLQPQHVSKIRLILTRLDAATMPEEMNVPGYGLHPLKGERKSFWAVKVDKNFRIVFRFEGENVHDIDYIDYH